MSDEATRAQAPAGAPATGAGASSAENADAWPAGGHDSPASGLAAGVVGERPELAVAAAFGGGLLAAILLRRLASGD